ncbi:thermonuclease family protein [Woodsholea maritima]|uniref:thermonuclease family protein n=1 Tax=Woodsholea maritima TaxID=240237 RepID=UPI0003792511|nr:thermonuclease family protein [Woodsholea maritima]
MREAGLLVMALMMSGCGAAQSQGAEANEPRPDGSEEELAPGEILVTSGDSFTWNMPPEGPAIIRLAEIDRPRQEPWASLAEARLRDLLSLGEARLIYAGRSEDRYGRQIAHVHVDTGHEIVWVQSVLVEEGLALVRSYPENRAQTEHLLEIEARARRLGRGAWADEGGCFTIAEPDPNGLAQSLDSFQIVEGRVIEATRARSGDIYLNFGTDWRTDFTVKIPEDAVARFDDAALKAEHLGGAHIRVRGWLKNENGPMIELDHPEALELLDESQAPVDLRERFVRD